MINIAALLALRDGAPATADEQLQHAVSRSTVAPAQKQAPAPSTYPAKSLVLKDGSYQVADLTKCG